jgi:hypothetical protein
MIRIAEPDVQLKPSISCAIWQDPAGSIRFMPASQFDLSAEIVASVQPLLFVSPGQASPNTFRARAKRDMTVPIGKAVISEIWR